MCCAHVLVHVAVPGYWLLLEFVLSCDGNTRRLKRGFLGKGAFCQYCVLALKICLPSMDIESSFSSSDVSGCQASRVVF